MSVENLEKFSKLLTENKEWQVKVKSFGGDADTLAAYAKDKGFDVTPEELREYQEKALQMMKSRVLNLQPDGSLSDGAKEFLRFIKNADDDEIMAKRLVELGSGTPGEVIAYGREKGFIFNEQDMQAVSKDILKPTDELDEEELEMVAGGTTILGVILSVATLAGMVAVAGGVAGTVAGAGAIAVALAVSN